MPYANTQTNSAPVKCYNNHLNMKQSQAPL